MSWLKGRYRSALHGREVVEMNRETSWGQATVRQICKALRVSPQAYYRSRSRPTQAHKSRPTAGASGPWASASELELGSSESLRGIQAGGAQGLGVSSKGGVDRLAQTDLGDDEGQGFGAAPDSRA